MFFSNIHLADGKPHAVILWLSGLQQGLSTIELYLDCLQVGAIEDLPKPFSELSQKVVAAELRTLQEKPQVSTGNWEQAEDLEASPVNLWITEFKP